MLVRTTLPIRKLSIFFIAKSGTHFCWPKQRLYLMLWGVGQELRHLKRSLFIGANEMHPNWYILRQIIASFQVLALCLLWASLIVSGHSLILFCQIKDCSVGSWTRLSCSFGFAAWPATTSWSRSSSSLPLFHYLNSNQKIELELTANSFIS